MEQLKIAVIVDSAGEFTEQYYNISNMKGELKDFDEFETYDDYENDMIERGAVPVQVIKHEI